MHRIDTTGHVNNKFSLGNPQAGQLATRLGADWPNDVQENLAYLIEQVGIELVKGDETQVYDAMVALIASIGGGGGGGGDDVPITRLVNAAGLATGGGALATDITITVAKATGAEVLAGLVDDKAITPLGLASAFVASFGASGYYKLPGGLIIQWGTGSLPTMSTTILSLPINFPTANLYSAIQGGLAGADLQNNYPMTVGRGLSTMSVFNGSSTCTGNFLAIGH